MTDYDDFHDRGFLTVLGFVLRRPASGEALSGNKNGVPRIQSMTESGGRRCPDRCCSGYFVLHSQRIHVDPMARLNAKAVPIRRNARGKHATWGARKNGTGVRSKHQAMCFDAAKHSDGATQHCVRASSEGNAGA
jgi:hypothetical protein